MDRIAKALQRASKAAPPHPATDDAMSDEIVYTTTRRLDLDVARLREQRLISHIEDKRIVDSYKVLRTRIVRRLNQRNWNTLGITSAGENEGKTLTSINLAISIAMSLSQTVLLVDADLRRPSLHQVFGFKPDLGLIDYFESSALIQSMLVQPGIDGIVLLPGRGTSHRSSELLASATMGKLVQEVKSRYPSRIVLFDLPPALVGDDALAFSPYLDSFVLVVEDGKTHKNELNRTLEVLDDADLMGVVLNKSSEIGYNYDYY